MDFPCYDLSITSDMVFQYVFSSPGCEPGLLSFINAVQADAHRPLAREVIVKSPFNLQHFLEDKRSILDIKAIDNDNRVYDIEMQTVNKDAFLNRILLEPFVLRADSVRRRLYPTQSGGVDRADPIRDASRSVRYS